MEVKRGGNVFNRVWLVGTKESRWIRQDKGVKGGRGFKFAMLG